MNAFLKYFNSFYGTNGVYPMRDVSADELAAAVNKIDDFCGDSFDREKCRDLIFTQDEQAIGYNQR